MDTIIIVTGCDWRIIDTRYPKKHVHINAFNINTWHYEYMQCVANLITPMDWTAAPLLLCNTRLIAELHLLTLVMKKKTIKKSDLYYIIYIGKFQ